MKRVCKIASAIMALVVALQIFSGVDAQATASVDNSLDAYIDSMAGTYLPANGFNCTSVGVSPVYEVNNGDGGICFFIDETVIGYMSIVMIEGEYFSSFSCLDNEDVDDIFSTEDDFWLGAVGSGLYIATDESIICLKGTMQPVYSDTLPYKGKVLRTIQIQTFNGNVRSGSVYYKLNLCPVGNTTIGGVKVCWAACAAASINYQQNKHLTAKTLYESIETATGHPDGTPCGTGEWVVFAFEEYDITAYDDNCGLNLGRIENLLSNYVPIVCFLNNPSGNNHAVLLTGVNIMGTTRIYFIMDPDTFSIVSVSVSANALTDPTNNFVYSTGTTTYRGWYESIYNL